MAEQIDFKSRTEQAEAIFDRLIPNLGRLATSGYLGGDIEKFAIRWDHTRGVADEGQRAAQAGDWQTAASLVWSAVQAANRLELWGLGLEVRALLDILVTDYPEFRSAEIKTEDLLAAAKDFADAELKGFQRCGAGRRYSGMLRHMLGEAKNAEWEANRARREARAKLQPKKIVLPSLEEVERIPNDPEAAARDRARRESKKADKRAEDRRIRAEMRGASKGESNIWGTGTSKKSQAKRRSSKRAG